MMTTTTTNYCECGHIYLVHYNTRGNCVMSGCTCEEYQPPSTEQPRPEQAGGEATSIKVEDFGCGVCGLEFTAFNDYIGHKCKPKESAEHNNDAPAAPERDTEREKVPPDVLVEMQALTENWNDKPRIEQITARHRIHDLSGIPNDKYTASWSDVKLLIEQHFTLIAQRERLLEITRLLLETRVEMNGRCGHTADFDDDCVQCQARAVLTTIEREGTEGQ